MRIYSRNWPRCLLIMIPLTAAWLIPCHKQNQDARFRVIVVAIHTHVFLLYIEFRRGYTEGSRQRQEDHMAQRKALAEALQTVPTEQTAMQESATATAVAERPQDEPAARQWRANPYPVKTVNVDGYKVQLQESRPDKESRVDQDKPTRDERWQMQIKFGSGDKQDEPSPEVLDFIKSHTKTVTTKEGQETQVQLFHWNKRDQAWGMEIEFGNGAAAREKAREVFDGVVELIREERGAGRER